MEYYIGNTPMGPIFENIDRIKTDRFLLTLNKWRGSHETGIRTIKDGVVVDDFELIQHGWINYKLANKLILHLLEEGENIDNISNILDKIKDIVDR